MRPVQAIPALLKLSPVSLASGTGLQAYTMGAEARVCASCQEQCVNGVGCKAVCADACVHTCVAWTFVEPLCFLLSKIFNQGFLFIIFGEERWLFSVMIAMIRPLGRNRRIYLNRRNGEGASVCAHS
jgi:hypothetical protein